MKRFLTILLMTVAFAMNVSVVNANTVTWGPNNDWTCEYMMWDTYVFNCSDHSVDCTNYSLYYTTNGTTPTTASDNIPWGPQIRGLSNGMTLKILVVGNNGYNNNYNHIFEFSISNNECTLVTGGSDDPTPTAPATPTISYSDYFDPIPKHTITINCNTQGASIYYTTDGTQPTDGSTPYTGAFDIIPDEFPNYDAVDNITIKAIAIKEGTSSSVASQTYIKTKPITDTGHGDYQEKDFSIYYDQSNSKIVIMSHGGCYLSYYCSSEGDGWKRQEQYFKEISYDGTSSITASARCIELGKWFSSKATYTNSGTQPTAQPTITFNANAGKVTAMNADDVDPSHIYYTTDGNDPTTSSNTWANAQSNGVTLSSNATIKVKAQADGKSASQVVSFTNSNLPTINCNDNEITYSNTEGYTLTYSTDGNHYNTNEITSISQNTTIYLKATNSNGVTVLTNKECTVVPTEAPTITCSGNTINISAVSGAVITYRYSTDGSTPSGDFSTSSGNTQAITVGAGQTVKIEAYATKGGVSSNTVTGGPYRYVPTAPTISEGVSGGRSSSSPGTKSPYIYLRITNYATVKPTDAYHVEYSFDGGQTYNTLTQSDGYIYIPASNFDGQDADISVYAKTVYENGNERFESAVVEKKLHKTVAPTVAYNSGKITITAATTGWDEIMFSTDGGHNWFIHNFNDGYSFDVYPTTQDAPSYDGESPLYVRARAFKDGMYNDNEALYMYSDEACYIGKPTVQDLKYTQVNSGDNTGLFNYFNIHSIEGLKVRYTTDGTDPTNSSTAKEYNMPGHISGSEIYEAEYDQYLSSSLVIPDEGMTLKVVATDGKGHFSDVYTSKQYQKSDMPIFTDYGAYIELSVDNPSGTPHNTIYYKTDSGNWPNAGSATPPYIYKKDFTTIQASALWNAWTKLYSDMLIVEVTTPTPTLSYDEDANQVTITCEEGKTLKYTINGGNTWQTADGQSQTLDVPQGGSLSVQAYCTSTAENTPETNMTTIYTSNVSKGSYTYTAPTAEWTDWEPYGRGTFTDELMAIGSDEESEPNTFTYDVEVRTKIGTPTIKQIRIQNWSNAQAKMYHAEGNNFVNMKLDEDLDEYTDFIFEWDITNNKCHVLNHYSGLIKENKLINQNTYYVNICQPTEFITHVTDGTTDSWNNPGKYQWSDSDGDGYYDPETDTYTIYVKFSETATQNHTKNDITYNPAGQAPLPFTLKMDGMWLGDMDEESDNSADQNSYMPQLSQYKIGLVKIPTDGTDTDYLDFENGVCRIVLDDIDEDDDIEDDFDAFFNSINGTERHWLATDATNQLIENSTDVYKMLDQFTITVEGAYYIVVARQVPNGDGSYSYTGAYQYMPVYYSPASNWEEVGEGECTYQDDIVGGLYDGDYGSEPTNYTVKVEENKTTPGLYRVKNMYGSGFEENDNEWYSYQGESPYRENVYFYIDATDPNSVKLYNDMFYAQPLGVDWGCGEMMLIDLGNGVVDPGDNGGIDIKFNQSGSQIGKMYEWEDWSDSGYEYDGTDGFGSKTNDDATPSNRFDLFIPAPSKSRPNAPTITSDKSTRKATITTDVRSTNNEADVYIFYTTDGTEPTIDNYKNSSPRTTGTTKSFDCNQYHDGRDKYDVTFDASNISTIKAMVYCKDEDKFELYYSKTSILLLRPEAPKITYDDSGIGTTHVTISTDLVGKEDNPVYLIYTTDGTKPVLGQHYTVGQDGVPTAISDNTIVGDPNETEITDNIEESKTYNALVYWENEEYEFYSYSPITTQYCPVWRDWELYGRGAWEHSRIGSSELFIYNAGHTTDIEIATDISKTTHKRIKIDGMLSTIRENCTSLGYSKVDCTNDEDFKDFIFEWDMTDDDNGNGNECYANPQYTGLKLNDSYLWLSINKANAYDTNVDSYYNSSLLNLNLSSDDEEYISAHSDGVPFTLKMDGLWLGDMVETTDETGKDYAIQYSYMPRNSHYKIGLVKIPEDGEDTEYLTFEDGKCFINLESAEDFEEFFGNSSNFVNAVWDGNSYTTIIERHWDASAMNSEAQPLLDNTDSVGIYKMCDQFKITEEGAYYIVAARLVPNGEANNETYSYSGAYRYMPVYYSPSSNWKTLSYDGMRTYRDDIVYSFYPWSVYDMPNYPELVNNLESAPVYSVEVQEKEGEPGLFRVKNMYHSGFMGVEDSEVTSYQGESPYREDVYFYIDAREVDDVKLYPSEFYAQPLGVDWGGGETMLTSLYGGRYANGQIVFEEYGCIYNLDDTQENIRLFKSGYIIKDSDLYDEEDTTNEDEDDQFKLQISTPYPLFDDTPYTTTDMNEKWPNEYEENSDDYNEKYGEVWAMFDEESDYYEDWYTDGITEGQDHVDVTYERSLADEDGNAKDIGTLVLPVDFTPSDIPGFKFYKLNDEKTTEGQIKFDKIDDTETITAHTPVVFKRIENTGNMSVKLYDRTVVKKDKSYNTVKYDEDAPSIRVGNWDVTGMYTFKAVTNKTIPEKYSQYVLYDGDLEHSYIVYNDKAKQVNGGLLLDPYRAYFHLDTSVQAPALISVFFDDEPVTGIDPTSGNEQRRGAEGSYNVAGQKVKSGYRGIVIENGKKRFVK